MEEEYHVLFEELKRKRQRAVGALILYSSFEDFYTSEYEDFGFFFPEEKKKILRQFYVCENWAQAREKLAAVPEEEIQRTIVNHNHPEVILPPLPKVERVIAKELIVFVHVKALFLKKEMEKLQTSRKLIEKYVRSVLKEEKILYGTYTKYSLVEPVTHSDKFGLYTVDPFFGYLKLIIQNAEENEPLPNRIRLDEESKVTVKFEITTNLSNLHRYIICHSS